MYCRMYYHVIELDGKCICILKYRYTLTLVCSQHGGVASQSKASCSSVCSSNSLKQSKQVSGLFTMGSTLALQHPGRTEKHLRGSHNIMRMITSAGWRRRSPNSVAVTVSCMDTKSAKQQNNGNILGFLHWRFASGNGNRMVTYIHFFFLNLFWQLIKHVYNRAWFALNRSTATVDTCCSHKSNCNEVSEGFWHSTRNIQLDLRVLWKCISSAMGHFRSFHGCMKRCPKWGALDGGSAAWAFQVLTGRTDPVHYVACLGPMIRWWIGG